MALNAFPKKAAGRLALAAAVLSAVSLTVAPTAAVARDGWRGHNGGGHHWRGDRNWGGDHWRGSHRRGGDGGAIALGLIGGALAGAALSNAYNYNYAYPYSYGYAYPYSYSYPSYGYYGYYGY